MKRPSIFLKISQNRSFSSYLSPSLKRDKWNKITDQIIISSSSPLVDKEAKMILDNNVNTVISLTEAEYFIPPSVEHIKKIFPDNVNTDLNKENLDEVCDTINSKILKGEKIVVNCRAGISRSVTLVIYWLMKHKKYSFDKAFEFVKEKRSCSDPNIAFLCYLKQKDKELNGL